LDTTNTAPSVRLAAQADLPAIGAIFNYYIAHSTCTFHLEPQTDAEYQAWFHDCTDAQPLTVVERDGRVLGWASLSPWKSRCAYSHSVEGSVYVHHECHREGVGKILLTDLIERAQALGHRTLIGGACTEHAASLALQKSFGFREVGVLKEVGYKFGRWLDVLHTQLML
jgi:phosphinothricin acetyltransferase